MSGELVCHARICAMGATDGVWELARLNKISGICSLFGATMLSPLLTGDYLVRRAFIVSLLAFAAAACGQDADRAETDAARLGVVRRSVDAENGMTLFVDKGCVICHSVNGVGGKAAPALDAEIGAAAIDPLDFAARMWRGAPAMIELQSVELGYTISLTADEIADLAAFAADRERQKTLSLDALPETLKDGLLDEQFWEVEDWSEYLRGGREGEAPIAPDEADGEE